VAVPEAAAVAPPAILAAEPFNPSFAEPVDAASRTPAVAATEPLPETAPTLPTLISVEVAV
jgi:hypothetical protein